VSKSVTNSIDGRVVLITGGTGSFGSTVVQRLLKDYSPKRIIIFSRDEKKQHDMRLELGNPLVDFQIGDTRDADRVRRVMRGVDLVFHAAALKQVPSCEFFPIEAVRTNVLGTNNVVEAAIAEGIEKFVALSTDKAVYPINAMGMTKAIMEKTVIANSRLSGSRPVLACVRYGNVMYSRGSVIPLFVDQIKAGKPLTVTEPAMTRFLLPLPVAIDLVIHALEHGRPGDTFIRKSPASTVGDLAQATKELFEYDGDIEEIGIRHGEKMYETLVTQEELFRAEDMGDFYRVPADTRDLNYAKYFVEGQQAKVHEEGYNSNNTTRLDVEGTKALLLQLDVFRKELAAWRS
jgi:UDP-N-acetylglucosamine 4,6-dehydratase/5-epimerase